LIWIGIEFERLGENSRMASKKIKALGAKALYQSCDLKQFDFKTTAELEPLDQPLGQDRALEAIEFGVEIEQQGFNLFLIGDPGFGKHDLVRQILSRHAQNADQPSDVCYVNNFTNPQKPRLLKLPAGMGQQLRQDMESLVEDLLTSLPSSFQSEEYRNRRQEIEEELQNRQDEAFRKLDREAEEKGIIIMRTPGGYTMGPMVDGRPLDPQEYAQLSDREKERIEKIIADLQQELQDIIRDMPLVQREHHQRIKALNEEITQHTVDQPEVMEYLEAVQQSAIKDADAFLPSEHGRENDNIASRVAGFHAYSINVIVDNTDNTGAPVVLEDHPTYQNLIGRVEYVSQMGTLITDFTLIKPGALHRANGGYLIMDARKLLTHGFAWEGLKRALKSREIKIQSLEQMLSLANTVSLEPESIPLNIKVILTGEPRLYYLLQALDHEFGQLFKVSADFARTTRRDSRSRLCPYDRVGAAGLRCPAAGKIQRGQADRGGVARCRRCRKTVGFRWKTSNRRSKSRSIGRIGTGN
jgi:predicted ATP-dependent protease